MCAHPRVRIVSSFAPRPYIDRSIASTLTLPLVFVCVCLTLPSYRIRRTKNMSDARTRRTTPESSRPCTSASSGYGSSNNNNTKSSTHHRRRSIVDKVAFCMIFVIQCTKSGEFVLKNRTGLSSLHFLEYCQKFFFQLFLAQI